jgi:ketopantoate reductase
MGAGAVGGYFGARLASAGKEAALNETFYAALKFLDRKNHAAKAV